MKNLERSGIFFSAILLILVLVTLLRTITGYENNDNIVGSTMSFIISAIIIIVMYSNLLTDKTEAKKYWGLLIGSYISLKLLSLINFSLVVDYSILLLVFLVVLFVLNGFNKIRVDIKS